MRHSQLPARPSQVPFQLETEGPQRIESGWGRLHLDRPLPWIGLSEIPRQLSSSDRTLIEGWPAYLVYSDLQRALPTLQQVQQQQARRFGAFLVLEVAVRERRQGGCLVRQRQGDFHPEVLTALLAELEAIARLGDVPSLTVGSCEDPADREDPLALLTGAHWLTIDLDPVHFEPETGQLYPMVGRALEVVLDRAARSCWMHFGRHHTTLRVASPGVLGRRHLLSVEWSTDRALTRINESYDFLLNITPINSAAAWQEFVAAGFERAPKLRYRPVNVDPEELRRTLFSLPIHNTEDPTLAQLFRAEQEGIDQKLRMLEQRDTPRFVFDSLHLYGTVDDELLRSAHALLDALPEEGPPRAADMIDAQRFASIAQEQIEAYRTELPELSSQVELRSDIASVMVAHGNLLVPDQARYAKNRVQGLLAHEVGTHVVTYFNGRAQPLQLLASGLSGADELQEGLAVLAEALAGELSDGRLRLLAARVLAVHRLTQGAGFVDVYRELVRSYSFARRTAFGIALRVFRGGGFTKDAIYLRGLQKVLRYLASGQALEQLLIGKFAFGHVPLVQQLLEREILRPAALTPHYLRQPEARQRLADLQQGMHGGHRLHCLLGRRAA